TSRPIRPGKARLRPVSVLASVVAVVLCAAGSVGLAAAADRSSPGDLLYTLDLALERIGIGAGGIQERIDEVDALIASDRPEDAVRHLRMALADAEEPVEAPTLVNALERLDSAVER